MHIGQTPMTNKAKAGEGERVDDYGNPLEADSSCDRLIYCCFPDCGCDGSRLCMAENGANGSALTLNLEKGSLRKGCTQ